MDDRSEQTVGHKLNGSNYRLWKFQIKATMRGRGLMDNIEGKKPGDSASQAEKETFERNEGKAMSIIIQTLDNERANFVLTCQTSKEMMDKLSNVFEKNSEIRTMTLYEEYFSLKMENNETIANYLSKVNQMSSEIEQQGEKLSEKLKMVRIISSLPAKFNNYKTVWYNTSETRTLDKLISSLQLEEDNLNRINKEVSILSDVAYAAKSMRKPFKTKKNIEEIKRRTKCNACGQIGHWSKDKQCPKREGHTEIAWCTSIYSNNESNSWYADSGASSHMTYHREWFSEFNEYNGKCTVKVANNCHLQIHGVGTILILARINNQWEPRRLENVLYVPKIRQNLFSTAALTIKGFKVIIDAEGCRIIDESRKVVAVGKRCEMNQLRMDFQLRRNEIANTAGVSLQHWHRRLGHVNPETIKKMSKDGLVEGIILSDSNNFFCEDCQYGKMTRSSHKHTIARPSSKGEYMHVDLCGPMEEIGIRGHRYFMLIKDEATSFRFTYLLKSKEEVYECFDSFISMVKNIYGTNIKRFRFDNGKEFNNNKIKALLNSKGIQIEYITAYTPEQNGRIERDNRTIQESARTMLIASGLKKSLWSEAVCTATYLLNRITNSKCIDCTPYEKWFGRKPSMSHIKIFGTECFVQIPKQTRRKKWDPKAKKVFLVGFEPTMKNFRLYDPNSNKVFLSCDVRFNESESKLIPVKDYSNSEMEKGNSLIVFPKDEEDEIDVKVSQNEVEQEISKKDDTNLNYSLNESFESSKSNEEEPCEELEKSIAVQCGKTQTNTCRYNLRSKSQTNLVETGYSALIIEPNTYEEAIQSKEVLEWKRAMDDEYESLIKNNTWDLVEPPKNQKVIDNRWVFKVKENTDGTIERFKARLVVRGFTQEYGVDYEEVFSPVVKFTSIRTILSLAAIYKMHLKQFDVKTAFLYGDLKENVYMKQPVGYEDKSGYVCKLKKSLYGLKQAPRCWNEKFTSFICNFGFKISDTDPCVFIRHKEKITIIAIYVDDGLIATECIEEINAIISYLQKFFEIKVFEANCYLGLEIERSEKSVRIHQESYIKKILNRFNMTEAKVVSTPMDSNQNLGDFVNDEKDTTYPYREAVGSLMYLSVGTRPDISYAVGVISRYLDRPSLAHVNAVKRIMRYLKGTMNTGITYESNDSLGLIGYSDADYAGDTETRRSTSGYVFHIGSGAVSWASTRQQSVSTSSTESEYISACQAVKELMWLKNLVIELTSKKDLKVTFFLDNQSAIRLIKNPVFHKRTKHIDIQYHFIREKYQEGLFDLEYIPTDEQAADLLTKALNMNRHKYLCSLMNLTSNIIII